MAKTFTTGDISRIHKMHMQTIQSRLRVLKLKPADKVGRIRLYSESQVRQIVKGK